MIDSSVGDEYPHWSRQNNQNQSRIRRTTSITGPKSPIVAEVDVIISYHYSKWVAYCEPELDGAQGDDKDAEKDRDAAVQDLS